MEQTLSSGDHGNDPLDCQVAVFLNAFDNLRNEEPHQVRAETPEEIAHGLGCNPQDSEVAVDPYTCFQGKWYTTDLANIQVLGRDVERNGVRYHAQISVVDADQDPIKFRWGIWSTVAISSESIRWVPEPLNQKRGETPSDSGNAPSGRGDVIWKRRCPATSIREPFPCEPDDVEGVWQANDGARIFVCSGAVKRNNVAMPVRIEPYQSGVRFGVWRVVDRRRHRLDWQDYRSGVVVIWMRPINRKRGHGTVRLAVNATEREDILVVLQDRLPGLSNARAHVLDPSHIVFGSFENGEILAGAVVSVHRQMDFCELLIFASKLSHSGYGTTLMDFVKAWCSETHGVNYLMTYGGNDALRFFEKQDFVEYDVNEHLSATVLLPRLYKPGNATLMCWEAPAVHSHAKRRRQLAVDPGESVEVLYGHKRYLWVSGVVKLVHRTAISVSRATVTFPKTSWKDERIRLDSCRLRHAVPASYLVTAEAG